MTTLTKTEIPAPVDVRVTSDAISVDLSDGRTITAPIVWFPRLLHGTSRERANFTLGRVGIHWPDLNEDIPVEGLLLGEKSGESLKSVKRWLDYRAHGKREPILTLPLPPDLARHLEKEKRRQRPARTRKRIGTK